MDWNEFVFLVTSLALLAIGVFNIKFRRRVALWQKQLWRIKKVDPASVGLFDELIPVLMGVMCLAAAAYVFVVVFPYHLTR